ncbi:hypothetical protein L1887_54094 [Cichorium endivia]|nr:hypothetical protein L1887_54094 [Cichorium endivia]
MPTCIAEAQAAAPATSTSVCSSRLNTATFTTLSQRAATSSDVAARSVRPDGGPSTPDFSATPDGTEGRPKPSRTEICDCCQCRANTLGPVFLRRPCSIGRACLHASLMMIMPNGRQCAVPLEAHEVGSRCTAGDRVTHQMASSCAWRLARYKGDTVAAPKAHDRPPCHLLLYLARFNRHLHIGPTLTMRFMLATGALFALASMLVSADDAMPLPNYTPKDVPIASTFYWFSSVEVGVCYSPVARVAGIKGAIHCTHQGNYDVDNNTWTLPQTCVALKPLGSELSTAVRDSCKNAKGTFNVIKPASANAAGTQAANAISKNGAGAGGDAGDGAGAGAGADPSSDGSAPDSNDKEDKGFLDPRPLAGDATPAFSLSLWTGRFSRRSWLASASSLHSPRRPQRQPRGAGHDEAAVQHLLKYSLYTRLASTPSHTHPTPPHHQQAPPHLPLVAIHPKMAARKAYIIGVGMTAFTKPRRPRLPHPRPRGQCQGAHRRRPHLRRHPVRRRRATSTATPPAASASCTSSA